MARTAASAVSEINGHLRIAFSRGPESPAEPDRPSTAPKVQQVEFVAYAADCILSGQLQLGAERVSDLLNDNMEFELVDVLVEDLTGGQGVVIRSIEVRREELLIVHASGPRGNAGRRNRTRQHPIVAKTGPYEVHGYVHALPGNDPIASLRRRKPMIALTDAVIRYSTGSIPQQRRASVAILNRDCVDWVAESRDEAVPTIHMPVDTGGLLLKDFTGDVRGEYQR